MHNTLWSIYAHRATICSALINITYTHKCDQENKTATLRSVWVLGETISLYWYHNNQHISHLFNGVSLLSAASTTLAATSPTQVSTIFSRTHGFTTESLSSNTREQSSTQSQGSPTQPQGTPTQGRDTTSTMENVSPTKTPDSGMTKWQIVGVVSAFVVPFTIALISLIACRGNKCCCWICPN